MCGWFRAAAAWAVGRWVVAVQFDRVQVLDALVGVVGGGDDTKGCTVLGLERVTVERVGEQDVLGEREVEGKAREEPV